MLELDICNVEYFSGIVDSTLCLADQKGLKQSDKAQVFLGLKHSDKLTKVLEE